MLAVVPTSCHNHSLKATLGTAHYPRPCPARAHHSRRSTLLSSPTLGRGSGPTCDAPTASTRACRAPSPLRRDTASPTCLMSRAQHCAFLSVAVCCLSLIYSAWNVAVPLTLCLCRAIVGEEHPKMAASSASNGYTADSRAAAGIASRNQPGEELSLIPPSPSWGPAAVTVPADRPRCGARRRSLAPPDWSGGIDTNGVRKPPGVRRRPGDGGSIGHREIASPFTIVCHYRLC